MGDASIIRQGPSEARYTNRLRLFGKAARPGLPARFAGVRGDEDSRQPRVAGAHAGGTTAGLGAGVGWRFGRESAAASLDSASPLLPPVAPRPTYFPNLVPLRNYICPNHRSWPALSKFWQ